MLAVDVVDVGGGGGRVWDGRGVRRSPRVAAVVFCGFDCPARSFRLCTMKQDVSVFSLNCSSGDSAPEMARSTLGRGHPPICAKTWWAGEQRGAVGKGWTHVVVVTQGQAGQVVDFRVEGLARTRRRIRRRGCALSRSGSWRGKLDLGCCPGRGSGRGVLVCGWCVRDLDCRYGWSEVATRCSSSRRRRRRRG